MADVLMRTKERATRPRKGKLLAEPKAKAPKRGGGEKAQKPIDANKELAELIKAAGEAVKISGYCKIDISPAVAVAVKEENPRLKNFMEIDWLMVFYNYLIQKVGNPSTNTLFATTDWKNISILFGNLVREAARGSVLVCKDLPHQWAYFLNCLRKKAGIKTKDSAITYSFSGVPADVPDGPLASSTTGFKSTVVWNTTTPQDLFQWVYGQGASQASAGGFVELVPLGPTVYNQELAIEQLGKLLALTDEWEMVPSSTTKMGKMDATRSVEPFQKNSNPGWVGSTSTTGFQSTYSGNGFPADFRIAQLVPTMPTEEVLDNRDGKIKLVFSGGSAVGFTLLNMKSNASFNAVRTFARPVPFDFGVGLSLFLRSFARLLRIVHGQDLSGLPNNLFNTLDLVIIFFNLIAPVFCNHNAFGGVYFPSAPTFKNMIGFIWDAGSIVGPNSTTIMFIQSFIERLREMLGLPVTNYVGVDKCSILRFQVLAMADRDYTSGVQAELSKYLDPVRVALVFPVQPAAPIVGPDVDKHLAGDVSLLTKSVAFAGVANTRPISLTQGIVIQNISMRFNDLMGFLSGGARITSGLMIGEGTVNRDLQILVQGDPDNPQNPSTGRSYDMRTVLSEKDIKQFANILRKPGFTVDYCIRNWMPTIEIGRVGGVDYPITNYSTNYALNHVWGEYGAFDPQISMKANQICPTPVSGFGGSELTQSQQIEMSHAQGGFLGFGWSEDQMKVVHELIGSGDKSIQDMGILLTKLNDAGMPSPLIRAIQTSPSVVKAITILARRLKGQKFLAVADKIVRAIIGVAGKL